MTKEQTFGKIITWSFALFFSSVSVLMFYTYFLNARPPFFISYLALTSFGFGVVSFLLYNFLEVKDYDIDYFKNIMIGLSGGFAVWILSEMDFSFKKGFWLTVNGFLLRTGFAIAVILIGYRICKKKK
mgnify:CR=1 FL=1